MKIGIFGAGRVGESVARQAIRAGHDVVLSNRHGSGSGALLDVVKRLGEHASAGTIGETAQAEVVVLAVPWERVEELLSQLPLWTGQILIDATNAPAVTGSFPLSVESGDLTSSAVVALLAPGARIVKAFNTPSALHSTSARTRADRKQIMFVSGDDAGAKQVVMRLADDLGYAALDLGTLRAGGILHQTGGPLFDVDLFAA